MRYWKTKLNGKHNIDHSVIVKTGILWVKMPFKVRKLFLDTSLDCNPLLFEGA